MECMYQENCGGCPFRKLGQEAYRTQKIEKVKRILQNLPQKDIPMAEPVFIGDNARRRASLAFEYKRGKLFLGFNENKSSALVDISSCCLLTPKINKNIEHLRRLLEEICKVSVQIKKGRKIQTENVRAGDILICEADNGLDVVLEFDSGLNLDHRMTISELGGSFEDIIRISHRRKNDERPETVMEKARPVINIAGYDVFIPAGTFLQASKESEKVLTDLVLKYAGEKAAEIADLFCGVGTFSYPLSKIRGARITAVDSSRELLEGFKTSVNRNRITNIDVVEKNLFKYPLDKKEVQKFDVVVFDPPRAGAAAQASAIASAEQDKKPERVVAVSCNPHSFVKDAGILIDSGYRIEEITLVDQFAYSNHSELVALFTKQNGENILKEKR